MQHKTGGRQMGRQMNRPPVLFSSKTDEPSPCPVEFDCRLKRDNILCKSLVSEALGRQERESGVICIINMAVKRMSGII
jgi:hypothetical protein